MKSIFCGVLVVLLVACNTNKSPLMPSSPSFETEISFVEEDPDGVITMRFGTPDSGETEWIYYGDGLPMVREGLLMLVKLNKPAPEALVLYIYQHPNIDPFIVKIASGAEQCYINEKYLIAYNSVISLKYAKLPTPEIDEGLEATVVYVPPGY